MTAKVAVLDAVRRNLVQPARLPEPFLLFNIRYCRYCRYGSIWLLPLRCVIPREPILCVSIHPSEKMQATSVAKTIKLYEIYEEKDETKRIVNNFQDNWESNRTPQKRWNQSNHDTPICQQKLQPWTKQHLPLKRKTIIWQLRKLCIQKCNTKTRSWGVFSVAEAVGVLGLNFEERYWKIVCSGKQSKHQTTSSERWFLSAKNKLPDFQSETSLIGIHYKGLKSIEK